MDRHTTSSKKLMHLAGHTAHLLLQCSVTHCCSALLACLQNIDESQLLHAATQLPTPQKARQCSVHALNSWPEAAGCAHPQRKCTLPLPLQPPAQCTLACLLLLAAVTWHAMNAAEACTSALGSRAAASNMPCQEYSCCHRARPLSPCPSNHLRQLATCRLFNLKQAQLGWLFVW